MDRARWVIAIALGLCGCSRADAAFGGAGSNAPAAKISPSIQHARAPCASDPANLDGASERAPSDPALANVGCQMMLWTRIAAQSRLAYTLSVVAENTTDHVLDFALPDACPNGSFLFEGLPDGYDYYQACNAGACATAGGMKNVSLALGERRVLASAAIAADGGGCNQPLDSVLYRVRALAPPASFRVCSEAASLDLRRVKIPAKAALRPVAQVPAPPAKPLNDFYACTRSSDCIIACPRVAGCCGASCGCQNAVRRDQVAAFEKHFAGTCTRAPNCPAVACAYQPAFTAECRAGRCEAAREPGL